MHEARLHVGSEEDAEPDEVDAEGGRSRSQKRNDDEGDFEKVEKECDYEDKDVDENKKANRPAGECGEQTLDPLLAADTLEHQAEGSGAQQNENHHGGNAHCGLHSLVG